MNSYLIATCNKGKQEEYQRIMLKLLPTACVDFPLQKVEVVEDGKTFEENALKKAFAYKKYTKKGKLSSVMTAV